ncbi:hypothetical protein R1sor_004272 [Riccia sorocarpa]|uniref:Integrase catalytic domain-containing protein n=1 Tax=Riccia sorocarpa TaxID=122646 RepID=A0ABD3H423_9MARC
MKGKHKKSSHYGVGKRAIEVLKLVQTDINGPSEVQGISGARYFITFIDDFSRWTTVYLLKKKSEAFGAFQRFKALVENQTGKKVKKLRSDGAGEYNSNQFRQFCEDHGLLRQVPKFRRKKFEDKSRKCIFMGYGPDGNGYKCWDPEQKKFLISSNVVV